MSGSRCVGCAVAQRHALALRASSAGTWYWHRASGVLEGDDALHALLGLEGSSLRTLTDCFATVDPRDRDKMGAAFSEAVVRGEAHHLVYRVTQPDGSARWIAHRGEPVRDGSGALVGVA